MSAARGLCQVGKYQLVPVRDVRRDDVRPLLGDKPGVYICNCPEPAWYEHFQLKRNQNHGIGKKMRMFAQMGQGSHFISMTFDARAQGTTDTWRAPSGILHLGYGQRRGRHAQLKQVAALGAWLANNRDRYAYCYVYNFDLPQFVAPLLAKWLLGKPLYVDYEDDCTLMRRGTLRNHLERVLRHTVDGAVCVSAAMQRLFPHCPTVVLNSFADLEYTKGLDYSLRDGMVFVYSGRLDDVRGADLIPDLVTALRQRMHRFKITVTGSGPLATEVQRWNLPEVDFCGFVSDATLDATIAAADACLILQKPDHPFSRGSFPSKIETYAAQHKPIYALAESPA